MKDILVFLTNGFEEIEALTCVDILRRANLNVKTVSLETTKEVVSKHNIIVNADLTFNGIDFNNIEIVILPGGTTRIDEHQELKTLLLQLNKLKIEIAAICAAPMVIGQLNLLKNKNATCYPGFEKYLLGSEIKDAGVVIDDNIITAKGPSYSLEFALTILEILTNKKTREKISKDILLI